MSNPLTIVGYANQVANLIGLNQWNLFEASYNGCSFMTLVPAYNSINPLTGIVNAAQYGYSTLQGTNVAAFNPNQTLLGTQMAITQSRDKLERKYVRHKIPNANRDWIEDQGWDGFKFKMYSIFVGLEYLIALDNFLQTAIAENSAAMQVQIGVNYHVLIHPIWNVLKDVFLVNVEMIYEAAVWQGVTLELTFECSNNNIVKPSLSTLAQIGAIFNALEVSIASLAQGVSLVKTVI